AELTIDIPTARGKQPVYPRMLYLRREILGPGQEPMPVPTEPTVPKHKKSALQTLPSPWTVGSNPPIPRPARPTKTVTLPISTRYVASMGGEVHEHHFVKWLKDSSDAWVWLLGLPDGLPKAEDVASARLTFAVWECHDKADMEVAATILAAPAVPGEVYDFAQIGLPIGSTTVKRSTTAEAFDPAIPYEIDITRGLRRMLRTGEGAGFGIRIVPNRAVDDGWTVRFTPDEGTEPQLVIDVYDG
ncbi:MAG TPA: hypothetical protein QGH10_07480, partial [Armatimonadota bacterium]|nr:hypothetical protein [Armatimonadota bacterium]